jgi:DNA-binding transcriptional ArsR family regulator
LSVVLRLPSRPFEENAGAARFFLELARLTGERGHRAVAETVLAVLSPLAGRYGHAAAEFAAVLNTLGMRAEVGDGPDDPDLLLLGEITLEVRGASRPTLEQIERLIAMASPSSGHAVVADRLGSSQRRLLVQAGWGWLDRSGHVRLREGGIAVDREIESLLGPDPTPPDPLGRPSGLAVALTLLREPSRVFTVREIARSVDLSAGAVSTALSELEENGLLHRGRRPRVPDLFWEVAARWRVRWFGLADRPRPSIDQSVGDLMQFGFDDVRAPGWAATGDLAAQVYGMRIVATGEAPRIYVPSQRALTWAVRTWGEAHTSSVGATHVGVPPTTEATRGRVDHPSLSDAVGWPLASPLVVALTMASDPDPRSREVLATWDPAPELEVTRVW